MNNNIYDTANQLERELRELDAFKKLEEAFNTIFKNDIAKKLFEDFRNIQIELQQKQMTGQEITEADMKHAEEIATKATENEFVRNLMEAERELSLVMEDINRIIMKPVQEVYSQHESAGE
ncbi:YlbF family regulator [Atopobacter phocae]|uniref:YlbF family regulator n=1 Tax=Atopobacter phocae TaxID=136492 RepID=UPI00046F2258|nr:YlbF family regulator [Atopobacter phocae]